MTESERTFKEKLDQAYNWPASYTFKFITEKHKVGKVKSIFPTYTFKERASSGGKYISITVTINADSSETIMDYYRKVHEIGGVIAL